MREPLPSGLARLDSEFAQRLGEALQLDVTKSAALSYVRCADQVLEEVQSDLRRAFDDNDRRHVDTNLDAAREALHEAIEELTR
jgi:hypothetical protein